MLDLFRDESDDAFAYGGVGIAPVENQHGHNAFS